MSPIHLGHPVHTTSKIELLLELLNGLLKSNQADVILDEMEVDFMMKRVGMEKKLYFFHLR